ncbi:hypothetical protein CsatB_013619 [Cannabis sativa]
MHERGLCFTCDKKYSFGHKCKNQVLILCGTDEDEEDEVAPIEESDKGELDDMNVDEVSLNALSNSINPRIFRLHATDGKETVEVLIDIDNNNFIQESLATC